jgi:mannose-6-phosphate isomerase-like protein (cupin superfamily)
MTPANPVATVLAAGESDFAWIDGGTVRTLARDDDARGAWSLIEHWTPPGQGVRSLHLHQETDQAFYILEGTMMFQLGPRRLAARAGTFVLIPRGLPHANWTEAEPARHLLICSPAGLERFFEETGQALARVGQGPALDALVKTIAGGFDSRLA